VLFRARIEFEGIVQGVGFRPFLHRLAAEMHLPGWVLNSSAGVLMELEGEQELLQEYVRRVESEAPPLSRILVSRLRFLPPLGMSGFDIKPSRREEDALTLLCPDVAVCADCLRELFDPTDRRYRYPFINCTNCGPRYTIVRALPYDRPQTTMAAFPLCPDCAREYADVSDRRYHAQPIACPVCGPRLWYELPDGAQPDGDALALAVEALKCNGIVAVKGLGGFHLACRADSDEAVLTLRRRKQRGFFKPLAVMVRSIEAGRQLCVVDAESERWLVSPVAPVVLLPLRDGVVGGAISRYVAPNLNRLGVLLPYTPLHHLLLRDAGVPLVMTSGNLSDEPIVADNDSAREKLGPLVDGLLLHNRPIHARCDDSVLAAGGPGECVVVRHSRGFSPFPVALPEEGPAVLAFGGDIKTTFAASTSHFAFLSPHLGDADQLATYSLFRETWEHYRRLFHLRPEAVACDMHAGYHTARWAAELAQELRAPLITVQHHHAHLAALLAEHGLRGPLPAIVADGTGYGADGSIWGGELLYGDEHECRRLAHLRPMPLAGGDEAVREPWRIALGLLVDAAPEALQDYAASLHDGSLAARASAALPMRVPGTLDPSAAPPARRDVELVLSMLRSGTGVVQSTALGRLFDGVAGLLGITLHTTYEGQAPMELEALLDRDWLTAGSRAAELAAVPGCAELDWRALVRGLVCVGNPRTASALLHAWIVEAFLAAVARALPGTPAVLAASGGCLQNNALVEALRTRCAAASTRLVTHREIPPNDGGLALGVLRVAQAQLSRPRAR
jgi:hydrogenase maturation protein HypF